MMFFLVGMILGGSVGVLGMSFVSAGARADAEHVALEAGRDVGKVEGFNECLTLIASSRREPVDERAAS